MVHKLAIVYAGATAHSDNVQLYILLYAGENIRDVFTRLRRVSRAGGADFNAIRPN